MNDEELDKLVDELLGRESEEKPEETEFEKTWKAVFVDELLSDKNEVEQEEAEDWKDKEEEALEEPEWKTKLLKCVDRNKGLRDDNFVSPYEFLLYTEETDTVESVELKDLALRHPWEEKDGRWQARDVGKLLKLKLTLWRQSVVANELVEEGVSGQLCATVVLCVPKDKGLPFSWVVVNAKTLPKESG